MADYERNVGSDGGQGEGTGMNVEETARDVVRDILGEYDEWQRPGAAASARGEIEQRAEARFVALYGVPQRELDRGVIWGLLTVRERALYRALAELDATEETADYQRDPPAGLSTAGPTWHAEVAEIGQDSIDDILRRVYRRFLERYGRWPDCQVKPDDIRLWALLLPAERAAVRRMDPTPGPPVDWDMAEPVAWELVQSGDYEPMGIDEAGATTFRDRRR